MTALKIREDGRLEGGVKDYYILPRAHEVYDPCETVLVEFTPELASYVLKTCNYRNRRMKPAKIRKMKNAIVSDRFHLTHQGVAFDAEGVLLDGQNRLQAIVESGRTVRLKVTYNLPSVSQAYMDSGSKRSETENLKFGYNRDVDRRAVATAKAMMAAGVKVDPEPDELDAFIETHDDALSLALSIFPGFRKGVSAGVVACVARASYHVTEGKIREFAEIFKGGPFLPGQNAPSQLGRQLMDIKNKRPSPQVAYQLTSRAITYFLQNKDVKIIRPLGDDPFPLP